MAQETDVVVVGMGPGGETLANQLAKAGLQVTGVEQRLLGGECPYYACVPTKMMVRAAGALAEARRVDELAGHATVDSDWAPVSQRIRADATDDWDDEVAVRRFEGNGGSFVRGTATLTGRRTVAVGDVEVRARRAVVVATGTSPAVPPIDGLATLPFWTNRDAVGATSVPTSLAVIGGGAVGVEFAQVFARFGAAVTVFEGAERLLPMEEPEAGKLVRDVFEREGIDVVTGAAIASVGHDGRAFSVAVRGRPPVEAEGCLVATGRRTDLAALGIEALGVDRSARFLPVDENLRVTEGVWAIGDVTGKGAFTHVATYQARLAAADILGEPHAPADYRALPRVTFSDPEIGAVGLTERQARDAGVDVATSCTDLATSARGWIHKAGNDGFVKLVADRRRGVLVGASVAGPAGGEVLGALAVAVHASVPISALREMIYAYPTFHRAIEDALGQLDVTHVSRTDRDLRGRSPRSRP